MVVLLIGSAEASQRVIDVEGQEWQLLREQNARHGKTLLQGVIFCVVCERPVYGYAYLDDHEHLTALNKDIPDVPAEGKEWFISCPYCGANVIKEVPNRTPLYLTTKGWKSVKD